MQESQQPVKKPPLHSVATRVILVVFLATFLTAAVVSGLAVESTYGFLRGDLDGRLPGEAAGVAARLVQLEEQLEQQVAEIASRIEPPGDVSERAALRAALATEVEQTTAGPTPLAALVLLEADGAIASHAGSTRWRDGLPSLAGESSGSIVASLTDGTPLVAQRSGHLVGILAPEVWIEAAQADGVAAASTLIVSADGQVLTGGVAGAHSARAAVTQYSASVYPDGESRFVVASAADFGDSGRMVILEQPFQVAFAPVFAVLTRVFLADLAIVMFFTLLSYRLTAAIVRPIEALSEGARRISSGELGVAVPEPPGSDEIALLTRTFNDMTRELRTQRAEIHQNAEAIRERNTQLQRANEVLEQLSITDGLTKLHNHRYFQDFLTREIKRVSRGDAALSMLLIDIDDFKRLNDRLGHAAGDNLLTGLARILNDSTRATDLVARYGGEEFVVVAPDTTLEGATLIAEKIRTEVAESSFILDDSMQLTKMTVSIGVALYRGNRKSFFKAADEALYRAKAAGKNCVICEADEADPPVAPDPSADPGELGREPEVPDTSA